MAETSHMIPLGTQAPDFSLVDTRSGKMLTLSETAGKKATVVAFICNHCPYVKHIQAKLVEVAKHYQNLGINFVGISANDVKNYPQDGPDKMREEAVNNSYTFPYLYDEDQSVAKAYHAACTPEFFVFDNKLQCVYRGRFDESTPRNGAAVTGNELCAALDCILAGKSVSAEQHASIGCGIKWK